MKKILLPLLIIPTLSFGNEMYAQAWNFPTPDESIVASGKLQSFCVANPDKCPAGVSRSASGSNAGGGSSLFTPTTSSSANQSSITVVGDGNTVTLTTTQSSENDQITAESQSSAEIDYEQVLNYND